MVRSVKNSARLAAVAGLVAMLLLVGQSGVSQVMHAFLSVGWGFLAIPLLHLAVVYFAGRAWRLVTSTGWQASSRIFLWARLLRDGVNDLLPVAQLGGSVVGVRLLLVQGAPPASATAGVLVDMTLEIVTQFTFTLGGVALLMILIGPQHELVKITFVGALLSGAVLAAFIVAQRWGVFKWLERGLEKLALHLDWDSSGAYTDLHERVHAIYRQRRILWAGLLLHLGCWYATALETWLALWCMGRSVSYSDAVVLESLGQAVRSAAFLIPGGLGVQEGGYMALGALFGLQPDVALALSLTRRSREVLLGLPSIVSWHYLETRCTKAGSAGTAGSDESQ